MTKTLKEPHECAECGLWTTFVVCDHKTDPYPQTGYCSRQERDVLDASDEPSDAALRLAATDTRLMVGIQNWAKAELKRRGLHDTNDNGGTKYPKD